MMHPWYYRLTLVGCALSWFMVGLHLPGLHEMTHHGGSARVGVLVIVGVVAVMAVATLLVLLRGPGRSSGPSGSTR